MTRAVLRYLGNNAIGVLALFVALDVPPEAETPDTADVFIDSLETGDRVAAGFSIVAVC